MIKLVQKEDIQEKGEQSCLVTIATKNKDGEEETKDNQLQDLEVFLTVSQQQLTQCKVVLQDKQLQTTIPYPFKEDQSLLLVKSMLDESTQHLCQCNLQHQKSICDHKYVLLILSLNSLNFSTQKLIQLTTSDDNISVTLELSQQHLLTPTPIVSLIRQQETTYRFDFSATNLPLKSKKFSIFKAHPLYSFYDIVQPSTTLVLYESDVSKMASSDPFWTLSDHLSKSQLSPTFTINIYQTSDLEKTQRSLIATVDIELETIIGPEQETMFDIPGTDGKTILMLDRVQEFPPNSEQ